MDLHNHLQEIDQVLIAFGVATTQTEIEMERRWEAVLKVRDFLQGLRLQQVTVSNLADAMDQLLDDMGKTGQSVSLGAKAQARVAFEPFRKKDDHDYDEQYLMSLKEAKRILKACDG